jgi:hypothetical protein
MNGKKHLNTNKSHTVAECYSLFYHRMGMLPPIRNRSHETMSTPQSHDFLNHPTFSTSARMYKFPVYSRYAYFILVPQDEDVTKGRHIGYTGHPPLEVHRNIR